MATYDKRTETVLLRYNNVIFDICHSHMRMFIRYRLHDVSEVTPIFVFLVVHSPRDFITSLFVFVATIWIEPVNFIY